MSINQENHHFLKVTELTHHHQCTTWTWFKCYRLSPWILILMCQLCIWPPPLNLNFVVISHLSHAFPYKYNFFLSINHEECKLTKPSVQNFFQSPVTSPFSDQTFQTTFFYWFTMIKTYPPLFCTICSCSILHSSRGATYECDIFEMQVPPILLCCCAGFPHKDVPSS